MNDFGKLILPDTLYFERLLPKPIERVWQYLTDDTLRGKWFAAGSLDPKVGGTMQLNFNHHDLSEEDDPTPDKYKEMDEGDKSTAIITAIEPYHLLAFEWDNSEVTIELSEVGEKVLLKLTHKKLKTDKETRIGTLAGWHTHLNILRDRLEETEPQGFWRIHMPLETAYEERIAESQM